MRAEVGSNRRGCDPAAFRAVEEAPEVFVPFNVLGKLRAGFASGTRGVENERILLRFLALPDVKVLHADDATTHHCAAAYRQLKRPGAPIPASDMWVAALALQHDLVLHARDRHFDHLPQLERLD